MDIQGRVVVISGGASGMGAQTARLMASKGAKVAILDLNLAAAQEVASSINGFAVSCQVADSEQVEKAVANIQQTLGSIRVCINCAGIATAKPILNREGESMPLADFGQVIQINLIGTFNLMRVTAAYMAKQETIGESQERGIIINTASIAAFEGQIGQTAYSASKGGVVAMTLPAARELARYHIRVMTIAPGLIATPMFDNLSEQVRTNLAASIPFPKRLGYPNEFAELALHIIQNPLLNGEVIRLDGGLRMAPK